MDAVVHFEVPFDDGKRAKKFYEKVFGWKVEGTPVMEGYQMVSTVPTDQNGRPTEPGGINGGLTPRADGLEHVSIAVMVPSMPEYLKKVQAAGGEVVMEPVQVGEMGLYARAKDTEGNVIGLFQVLKG